MSHIESYNDQDAPVTAAQSRAFASAAQEARFPSNSQETADLKAENRRLLMLIAELLIKNEQLRERNSSGNRLCT